MASTSRRGRTFYPSSYGYRPGRRAQDAIAEIHRFTSNPSNYEWVVEADELYPDVVDGLENEGGVPSRLIKTDAGVGRQEGTPMVDVRRLPVGEDDEIAVTLDDLAREGARRMIAAALQAEAAEYVASFVDEVDEDGKRLVVRNGRARERKLTVGSGTVPIRAPRVNDKRVDESGLRRVAVAQTSSSGTAPLDKPDQARKMGGALQYTLPAGQRYVVGQALRGEYYWAPTFDFTNHTLVRGKDLYYQIQFGHRAAYVKASDVRLRPSWR